MKNVKKLVAMAMIFSMVSVNMAYAAPVNEVVGKTAVETSIELAQKSWNGEWEGEKTVVLAAQNEENLVDALSVAPLAYSKKAPILLVNKGDVVNKPVLDELKDKEIEKVYLASGEGILTDKMKEQLEEEGMEVVRVGGKNRIETSENIAEELGSYDKVAVVGYNGIADAISIAPIASTEGMAIAIVGSNGELTKDYKVDMKDKEAYILGGETLVSKKTEEEINAKRITGKDRYETNAKILETFKDELEFNTIYMPSGLPNKLKDGLSTSVLAAQNNNPVVLLGMDKSQMEETNKVLEENVKKDTEISIIGQVKSENILELVKKVTEKIDELNEEHVEAASTYKFSYDLTGKTFTVAEEGTVLPITLEADKVGDFGYTNALVKVEVISKPEDSKLQILAKDTEGTEWDLAQIGQWGPSEGFAIAKDYSEETKFTVKTDTKGKYEVKFSLVDVKDSNKVLTTSTIAIDALPANYTGDKAKEYVEAQDFGYFEEEEGYNVGFKINTEKLPYEKIEEIKISLIGEEENVATRIATGDQILKLKSEDETYGGIDGQLSTVFKNRDSEESNEYWTSSPYNLFKPVRAEIKITDINGNTYTVENIFVSVEK
ncbi:cell wall-binding repeat-containing protein [Clostridium sp. UBA6640]|uniref:cell wall-binding repeat-containing protein n=1 Tax=Clostridium sp. UBA6640 TaxID=1946370 RepID=UPI0025BDF4EF|nr:cell wall-binding repeat-containing protein [Clostridium sp. UBA6640]